MQEVIFTLQTITPLFLAGADQTTAELRAPSFRGGMRYWYRAMVGGLVGTEVEQLKQVRDAENSIFGTTDKGSPINIRILDAPTKTFSLRREGTGKDYLLWSVLKSRRQCFLPETQFRVELSAKDAVEQQILGQAISAFWLLTHLGGIGSRSRRCGGSLDVQVVKGQAANLPFGPSENVQVLKKQLEDGIKNARKLCNIDYHTKRNAHFDILDPGFCDIWILQDEQPWDNVNRALSDIGERLQTYRQTQPIQKRKIFGIPVMVLNNDGKSRPLPITGTGSTAKRIASPLHLHLSEMQTKLGKRYVGVATLFKTRWRDMSRDDYQLYQTIEDWIGQEFPHALEVTL